LPRPVPLICSASTLSPPPNTFPRPRGETSSWRLSLGRLSSGGAAMKKLKILLGAAASGSALESALASWGFDVVTVPDGKQACSAIRTGRFDLCLLDWDMPRMSGLEACCWIRSVNLSPQPHVVLITRNNRPEQIQAAYLAGANDYLTLPFNLEELHFLVSAFALRLSKLDCACNDFQHLDPLDQYRRDLAPSARIHSRL